MKVWDRAGIKLATPGSSDRLLSVARHVTDWATRPDISQANEQIMLQMLLKQYGPAQEILAL